MVVLRHTVLINKHYIMMLKMYLCSPTEKYGTIELIAHPFGALAFLSQCDLPGPYSQPSYAAH